GQLVEQFPYGHRRPTGPDPVHDQTLEVTEPAHTGQHRHSRGQLLLSTHVLPTYVDSRWRDHGQRGADQGTSTGTDLPGTAGRPPGHGAPGRDEETAAAGRGQGGGGG